MLFNKLWGKLGSTALLDQYQGVLKRPKVSKDMKNFHTCDTFFKHVIDAYVVALIMEKVDCKNIDKFWLWIARSNWPSSIKRTQEQYLQPFYIQRIRAEATRESEIAITSTLIERKEEWAAAAEERDTPELKPDWDEIRTEIKTRISTLCCDIVRENFLIITSLGLLYLDFANACRTGHSGRIKQ